MAWGGGGTNLAQFPCERICIKTFIVVILHPQQLDPFLSSARFNQSRCFKIVLSFQGDLGSCGKPPCQNRSQAHRQSVLCGKSFNLVCVYTHTRMHMNMQLDTHIHLYACSHTHHVQSRRHVCMQNTRKRTPVASLFSQPVSLADLNAVLKSAKEIAPAPSPFFTSADDGGGGWSGASDGAGCLVLLLLRDALVPDSFTAPLSTSDSSDSSFLSASSFPFPFPTPLA